MPIMDGFQATSILKERYPRLLILGCTANTFE